MGAGGGASGTVEVVITHPERVRRRAIRGSWRMRGLTVRDDGGTRWRAGEFTSDPRVVEVAPGQPRPGQLHGVLHVQAGDVLAGGPLEGLEPRGAVHFHDLRAGAGL